MTPRLSARARGCLLVGALSCSRGSAGGATDARPDSSTSTAAQPDDPAPESRDAPRPIPVWPPATVPAGEARRVALPRLEADASLRPYLTALRDHFGAAAAGPFELQSTPLVGGRTGLLLERATDGDPVALVVDRDGIDWSKPRPTAGILPPVQHLAITPHPDGGLVFFAWVATLRTVAARMWTDDGAPFGDFELFTPPACDALSAAYGQGVGWVVACSSAVETRGQRMRDDETVAWSRDGLALGAGGAAGPATILFDTPASFVVLQRAAAVGGDRLVAYRYDLQGEPLWSAPVQVGALPPGGASERWRATGVANGVVRVELPRGLAGKSTHAAEISADGSVKLDRR